MTNCGGEQGTSVDNLPYREVLFDLRSSQHE